MGSVLLRDEAQSSAGGSSVALDMDQIQQQDQMLLIDESETYHKSRFNAMQNIESSITELGKQNSLLFSITSNFQDKSSINSQCWLQNKAK